MQGSPSGLDFFNMGITRAQKKQSFSKWRVLEQRRPPSDGGGPGCSSGWLHFSCCGKWKQLRDHTLAVSSQVRQFKNEIEKSLEARGFLFGSS